MTGLLTGLLAAFAIATGAVSVSAAMMGANAGRRLFRNIMGLLLPGGHTRHRTVDRVLLSRSVGEHLLADGARRYLARRTVFATARSEASTLGRRLPVIAGLSSCAHRPTRPCTQHLTTSKETR
jgi:hypothetical protein